MGLRFHDRVAGTPLSLWHGRFARASPAHGRGARATTIIRCMHAPSAECDATQPCRRCGQMFTLSSDTNLPCCPHCGAVVRPWVPRLRDNKNAAILAFLALGFLTAGILLPFMSMSKLGMETSFSMLAGIRELYERGHALLAAILLVFSVIFPYAKLFAILLATTRLVNLSLPTRRMLNHAAKVTGRYSLLDIVVVAVIIVVVKFENIAEARALPGTTCSAAAVQRARSNPAERAAGAVVPHLPILSLDAALALRAGRRAGNALLDARQDRPRHRHRSPAHRRPGDRHPQARRCAGHAGLFCG